jgi:hypothetical protein
MFQEVTFGQNMADEKKFAKVNQKDLGVDDGFTEDEIIQIARPDSVYINTKSFISQDARQGLLRGEGQY